MQAAKLELATAQQQLEEAQAAAMLAAEEASQAERVQKSLQTAQAASAIHAQDLVTARAALATQESLLQGVKVCCAVPWVLCWSCQGLCTGSWLSL